MKLEKNNIKKSTIGRTLVFILCLTVGFISCSKDDDETEPLVPPRDRTEQQVLDNDSIIDYLESHYYNSDDFLSNANPSTSDLIITKLEVGESVPGGHTLLKDAVGLPKTIVYEDANYDIYVLVLNEGGRKSPTFSDNILVSYEGFTLKDKIFDSAVNPLTFDLTQLIPGWRKVLTDFNTSESFEGNGDGTVSFTNHGAGVMFLPSGLAYFANAQTEIPAYSPIAFKFDLYRVYENDFDGDGIPSYLEDLNDDGEFTMNFDNSKDPNDDDTDGDFNLDYADSDDDGDGILTRNEITITTHNKPTRAEVISMSLQTNQVLLNKIIKEQNGSYTGKVIAFPDTDSDGVPDYLDNK